MIQGTRNGKSKVEAKREVDMLTNMIWKTYLTRCINRSILEQEDNESFVSTMRGEVNLVEIVIVMELLKVLYNPVLDSE